MESTVFPERVQLLARGLSWIRVVPLSFIAGLNLVGALAAFSGQVDNATRSDGARLFGGVMLVLLVAGGLLYLHSFAFRRGRLNLALFAATILGVLDAIALVLVMSNLSTTVGIFVMLAVAATLFTQIYLVMKAAGVMFRAAKLTIPED